ncbi:MAG: hypothetical protein QM831_34680 [Kofleriaceae bacterium]
MAVEWRCPKSHEPLIFFPESAGGPFYLCPASRMQYRVDNGIPVFLVDEATELSATDVTKLVQKAADLGLSH